MLMIGSIVCVGNVLVTNLVAQDEQSVGGALFQTSYTVGAALGNNLSSLVIERVGIDRGNLLQGLRAASGLNTAAAWISESLPSQYTSPIDRSFSLPGRGLVADWYSPLYRFDRTAWTGRSERRCQSS